MSESIITLWINSETNSLLPSWNSFGSATIPSIKQGDSAKIEIHWIKSDSSGTFMSEVAMSPASTLKLAVGSISGVPTEGYFTYNYQGDTVQIPYNADVTSFPPVNPVGYVETNANTLINSLPSIIAAGGVVVSIVNQRTLRVVFNNFGVRALSYCDATTLRPSTNISVTKINTGGATTKEVQHLRPKVLPIAYTDSFSASPSPVISITNIDSITKRISITPQPKFGTFTISNGTLTTSVLSINSSASDVLSALTSANINSSTRLYSVAKSGDYSWDIYRTSGTAETLTVTDSGMIGFESKFGIIDFNTIELEDYLGGSEKANATIEVEYSDGTIKQTLYQGTVSIVNDLIESSLYSPIPFPELSAGIGEAPMDSILYGRKDGIWSAVVGDGNNIPDYNNGITYTVGNQVYFQGKLYRMQIAVGAAGYDPVASPSYWESLSGSNPDLTNYLTKDGGSLNSGAQLDFDNAFGVSSIGPMGAGFYEAVGTKNVSIYNDRVEVNDGVGSSTIVNTGGITLGVNSSIGLSTSSSDSVYITGSSIGINSPAAVNQTLLTPDSVTVSAPTGSLVFDATGITFPDATVQTTAALPLTGGTLTGQIYSDFGNGYISTLSDTGLTVSLNSETSNLEANILQIQNPSGNGSLSANQLRLYDNNTGSEIFVTANGLEAVASIAFSDGSTQTTAYSGEYLPLTGGAMYPNAFINFGGSNMRFAPTGITFPDATVQTTAAVTPDLTNYLTKDGGWLNVGGDIKALNGSGRESRFWSEGFSASSILQGVLSSYSILRPWDISFVRNSAPSSTMTVNADGLVFPDSTAQTTAALPLTGGTMTGSLSVNNSTFNSNIVNDGEHIQINMGGGFTQLNPQAVIFNNGVTQLSINSSAISFPDGTTQSTAAVTPDLSDYALIAGATFTGKVNTTQTTTTAPLNLGFLSAAPTTTVAGDIWIGDNLNFKDKNGVSKLVANASTQNTFAQPQVIAPPSTALLPALRITNTAAVNSFVVEDANNPDTSAFIINADGRVGIGQNPATWVPDLNYSVDVLGTTKSQIFWSGGYLSSSRRAYLGQDEIALKNGSAGMVLMYYDMSQLGLGVFASQSAGFYATSPASGQTIQTAIVDGKFWSNTASAGWTEPYLSSANFSGYAQLSGATFTGKVSLSPTATLAGLNIGSATADPTSTTTGDIWIGTNSLNFRDSTNSHRTLANLNTVNTFSTPQVIQAPTSASLPALRISNSATTSGVHSLVVGDSANPDISSFVIDNNGNVGIAVNPASWTPTRKLEVNGSAIFNGKLNTLSPDATSAGLNIGYKTGTSPPTTTVAGDVFITDVSLLYKDANNTQQTVLSSAKANTITLNATISGTNTPLTIYQNGQADGVRALNVFGLTTFSNSSSSNSNGAVEINNASQGRALKVTTGDVTTAEVVLIESKFNAGTALRITNTGNSNSLIVEDSANPDTTSFIINNVGNVGIGVASGYTPVGRLDVAGSITSTTATDGTDSTVVATTAFVKSAIVPSVTSHTDGLWSPIYVTNWNSIHRLNFTYDQSVQLPTNAQSTAIIGTQVVFLQLGAGRLNFTPTNGNTVMSAGGKYITNQQYSVITAIKTGANEWLIAGDLSVS